MSFVLQNRYSKNNFSKSIVFKVRPSVLNCSTSNNSLNSLCVFCSYWRSFFYSYSYFMTLESVFPCSLHFLFSLQLSKILPFQWQFQCSHKGDVFMNLFTTCGTYSRPPAADILRRACVRYFVTHTSRCPCCAIVHYFNCPTLPINCTCLFFDHYKLSLRPIAFKSWS